VSDRALAFVLSSCIPVVCGCSVVLDTDGYVVATERSLAPGASPDAQLGPAAAAFDHYRFVRSEGPFTVSAADGLASNDASEGLPAARAGASIVAGRLPTRRGGSVELAADGSFAYSPPGPPGAFWGDDHFEYEVAGNPPARARVRLTLHTNTFAIDEVLAGGTGFGVAGATVTDVVGSAFQSFASAGDVNGDGLEDFVVGAPGPVQNVTYSIYRGQGAYVVFGKPGREPLALGDLGGEVSRGFAILPDNTRQATGFGQAVGGAGDVNGDGLDDVIVGSPGEDLDGDESLLSGAAYVVFGKRDAEPVAVAALRVGQGGFVIQPSVDQGQLGHSVAGAGDVNGDGLDDVIVGIPQTAPVFPFGSGGAQVVFGRVGTAPVQLGSVAESEQGFFIQGVGEDTVFGIFVSGLGDVNGDALDDVAVMTPYIDGRRGNVAVVLGKDDPSTARVAEVARDPALGFVLRGVDEEDLLLGVSGAGDVNADGLDDIVINAPFASVGSPGSAPGPIAPSESTDAGASAAPDAGDAAALADASAPPPAPEATDEPATSAPSNPAPPSALDPVPASDRRGAAYVVYGARERASMSLLEIEVGGSAGFFLSGTTAEQHAGAGVGAGDVNGDGYSDILMGNQPTLENGDAFVVLGGPTPRSVTLPAEPGTSGVVHISALGNQFALGVLAAGSDLDGDGIDDMLLGAALYPNLVQTAGGAYAAFGWDMSDSLGERDGALLGSAGDDFLPLPATPIVVARGGNGSDTLQVGARTTPVDLRERGRYESIETIDARGAGPHELLLDETALRRLPQNQFGRRYELSRLLSVLGDADDTLRFDMTGYERRGGANDRIVYARPNQRYGLEVSRELTIVRP